MERGATRRLMVVLLVAGCGCASGHSSASTHPAGIGSPVTALMGLRDRPHPHGLEEDDRARWTPRWGPQWKGGGRHPVWRGCRRVYDPSMNAFLNAPGPVPTVSGA